MAEKIVKRAIPPAPRVQDREQLQFFSAIKEAIETLVTEVQFNDSGVATRRGAAGGGSSTLTGPAAFDIPVDFRAPNAPTGLEARGTIATILLSWAAATGADLSHYEIWRAAPSFESDGDEVAPTLSDAVFLGSASFTQFADSVDPGEAYYYWVRAVSTGGTFGPYTGPDGVRGATKQDPIQELLDVSGAIKASQLTQELLADIPNLAGVPTLTENFQTLENDLGSLYTLRVDANGKVAGFGLGVEGDTSSFTINADAFNVVNQNDQGDVITPFSVQNGKVFMNTAVIADATLTSAMISDLTADKITAVAGVASPFADIGQITAGKLQSSDGGLVFDLDAGYFAMYDPITGQELIRFGNL